MGCWSIAGLPQHICWYPSVHLGEEKHCESKVSCLRTQHSDPGQGSNPYVKVRSRVLHIREKEKFFYLFYHLAEALKLVLSIESSHYPNLGPLTIV